MTGVFSAKRLVIWHTIAPTYAVMVAIIMDMSPWIAQVRYHCLVHQCAAGLTPMTGVGYPPLDITVTPDAHTMMAETDLDSVALNLTPVTTAIEVVAARTLTEVAPDLSTDFPIAASHVIGALVPTTAAMTYLTADLHLIGILPEITADLDTDQESNTTDQPKDLHPLCRHHLGNIRTRDTNRSQLTTHHQSTTAQMTMKVTQMMI